MNKWSLIFLFPLLLLSSYSCTTEKTPETQVLRVMSHNSFNVSEEFVQQFEAEHDVEVQFLKSGDSGTALNRAILARDNPLADVFFGVDNTFLSRALDENIFEVYDSDMLAMIDSSFRLDPENRAIPIDYADVCLNYDRAYFTEHDLAPPQSLQDLLKPEYRGLLVVENPAMSSPGLAFLFATIGHFGSDGYLAYWQELVANEVLIVNDWESAYYTEFSLWGGERPLVLSYSSSPPFEYIYAEEPLEEPPSASISNDHTCFRQIEFAGILKGTAVRELAEAWIDSMLSTRFQSEMPLNMAVFPVNPDAEIDPAFKAFLDTPQVPVTLDPADIAAHREEWIQAWTETVLR